MEEKIKEIEAKKAIYVEKDTAEVENAAENHKRMIEERLAELDARLKEDKAIHSESLQRMNRGAGRGQRGARGRDNTYGDRPNNRGRRGGRGGMRDREERPERRNDFKVSDDEADEDNQEFLGREEPAQEEFKPSKAGKK